MTEILPTGAMPLHEWVVAPGFDAVAETFSQQLQEKDEIGAAFAVYYRGQPLLDLWGGYADSEQNQLWQADTLQLVFSASKAVTTIAIHQLTERGLLEVNNPIAFYWPEFARAGKEAITIAQVMTHRAAMARVDGRLTAEDIWAWQPVVEAIAAQAPNFEPGLQQAYHARSFGWILGELIRRVSGLSPRDYIRQKIVQPLGLDLHLGVAAEDRQRVARVYPDPVVAENPISDYQQQVMTGPSGIFHNPEIWNLAELQQAQMPSSNAMATARSLARMMAAVVTPVDGIQLLADKTWLGASRTRSCDKDLIMGIEVPFGLGFMTAAAFGSCPSASSFGHLAAGGGFVMVDPQYQLAMAYTPNRMRSGPAAERRRQRLMKALYNCLETT